MAHRRNCDTDSYEYAKDTESDTDEDYYYKEEQPSLSLQQKQSKKWGPRSQADQTYVHQFPGGDRGKEAESSTAHKDSSPLHISMLYFTCY
jgi:hypothetical protein